jgi:hypothetical protein
VQNSTLVSRIRSDTLARALDSFAVIANMQSCYFYLISNFANPLAILRIDWSLTVRRQKVLISGR